MIALNAFDAISPAWARAWRLLKQRRSWATALKLTFVAMLAEVGGGLNFNFNMGNHAGGQHSPMPPAAVAAVAAFVGLIVAVFFLIAVVLFYVGSRMQFVVFDLLLRQGTEVRPSWRLFGGVTWRWIGVRLLVLLAVLLLFSPLVVPLLIGFLHVAASGSAQGHPGAFFAVFAGYFGTILMVVLALFLVNTVLRTFGLPAVAMENAGLGTTLQRSWELFRADMGQSLLYLLMQIVFRFAMLVGGYISLFVVALISLLPPGLVALVLYFATRNLGTGGKLVLIAGGALLGLLWVAWIFVATIYIFGSMELFLSAYAIYFAAGRYAPLGGILQAQEPQLAYPAGYGPYAPAMPMAPQVVAPPTPEPPPEIPPGA